jgi:hypothetical protein
MEPLPSVAHFLPSHIVTKADFFSAIRFTETILIDEQMTSI